MRLGSAFPSLPDEGFGEWIMLELHSVVKYWPCTTKPFSLSKCQNGDLLHPFGDIPCVMFIINPESGKGLLCERGTGQ
jgi:hypothetical protein